MGRSRRKYKQSRTKVRVGLPKKNPRIFKPAFSIHPKLLQSVVDHPKWDDKASVIQNYNSFGVVSNPNLLSVKSRTPLILQTDSLQLPPPPSADSEPIDSGSDLEEDELRSALGKKRRDGKSAAPRPLTAMQRFHIGRLVNKYGDDYQSMMMDIKLNAMQHSVGTLHKLCTRYYMYPNKNPLIFT